MSNQSDNGSQLAYFGASPMGVEIRGPGWIQHNGRKVVIPPGAIYLSYGGEFPSEADMDKLISLYGQEE